MAKPPPNMAASSLGANPMASPEQAPTSFVRLERSSHDGCRVLFGSVLLLLFLQGCAADHQLTGHGGDSLGPASPASSAPPVSTPGRHSIQAAESGSRPSGPKTAEGQAASSVGQQSRSPALTTTPSPTPSPAHSAGTTTRIEPASSHPAADKDLAEKDRSKREKDSRATSDKREKKPSQPRDGSRPRTNDAHLPPVPPPSKPAAIGGSGG